MLLLLLLLICWFTCFPRPPPSITRAKWTRKTRKTFEPEVCSKVYVFLAISPSWRYGLVHHEAPVLFWYLKLDISCRQAVVRWNLCKLEEDGFGALKTKRSFVCTTFKFNVKQAYGILGAVRVVRFHWIAVLLLRKFCYVNQCSHTATPLFFLIPLKHPKLVFDLSMCTRSCACSVTSGFFWTQLKAFPYKRIHSPQQRWKRRRWPRSKRLQQYHLTLKFGDSSRASRTIELIAQRATNAAKKKCWAMRRTNKESYLEKFPSSSYLRVWVHFALMIEYRLPLSWNNIFKGLRIDISYILANAHVD